MKDWARLAALLLEAAGDQVASQGCPAWCAFLTARLTADSRKKGSRWRSPTTPTSPMGWVATPDCQAVGLVATGRLRSLEGGPLPSSDAGDPGRDRLRMACLVSPRAARWPGRPRHPRMLKDQRHPVRTAEGRSGSRLFTPLLRPADSSTAGEPLPAADDRLAGGHL